MNTYIHYVCLCVRQVYTITQTLLKVVLYTCWSHFRTTSMLESSMLLNIQQPFPKLENTILIPASPDKVQIDTVFFQCSNCLSARV